MKSEFENYFGKVEIEAVDFVEEIIDEVRDFVVEEDLGAIEELLYERLHETIDSVFIYTDLIDHAHIIQSSDCVETDSGLWEGQEPLKALETQAFFTYKYDVLSQAIVEIKSILSEQEEQEEAEKEALEEELEVVKEHYEELSHKFKELEKEYDSLNGEAYPALEQEIEKVKNKTDSREYEISELEEKIEEKETIINNIVKTIEGL